ncbi:MAG: MFS transporter [Chloroflexota bacterium]|nr:MFS transporter [Chloroflexota bacterium]
MRPRAGELLTLLLASAGLVSLGLPEGLLGVAWPSIRATFGLSLDALGMLLATFAAGYFLASAVHGRVLARVGIGPVLSLSCALTGACLVGYSLAPSWPLMVALGAAVGVGGGTIDAALNVYAAVRYGPRVLNILHAAFGLGAAVGPLIMTTILSRGGAWNLGYLAVGLAQLGLAVSYGVLRRRFGTVRSVAQQLQADSIRMLLRQPLAWTSIALFGVYAGLEVAAGQWSFSLFTEARGISATTAGVWVSAYWASLTAGRLIFGFVVGHVAVEALLRACTVGAVAATSLMWLNLAPTLALAVVGLALAPIFPSLIATSPGRFAGRHTADVIGLQVAAAVLGGASLPGLIGVLAARLGLEAVGPCLVALAGAILVLHEGLLRLSRACERPRSARSRTDAVASSPPGA